MIAKSPIYGMEPSSTMMLTGLMALGASMPLITIPLKPECLDAIETRKDLYFNPQDITNMTTSLLSTFSGLGRAAGPFLNSFLFH